MPKRTDANQAEIVAALRRFGAFVQDLHMVGHGCPDLLVSYRRRIYVFEVKTDRGKLTADEWEWQSKWQGDYYIIHDLRDAIEILAENR